MKHIIYGISLLAVAIMVIAGVMVASGGEVRGNEADKALNTAVEQSLEQLMKYGSYQIGNEQELVADFQQALLLHISSDSDIEVKILAADAKRGVLDVEVTETYKTINNKVKQASCRKTVILEEYTDEKGYCVVKFLLDGAVYETYSLYKGSRIVMPQEPRKSGSVFQGWKKKG